MNPIKKLQRMRQMGPRRVVDCIACKLLYSALRPIFRYQACHSLEPYACREYKQLAADLASTVNAEVAVDLGCGIGEIIARTRAKRRYGIDYDQGAIRFAQVLYGRKAQFQIGTLFEPEGVCASLPEKRVDVLIITGLLHGMPFDQVQAMLARLRELVPVERLLMDTVRRSERGYTHTTEDLSRLGTIERTIDVGDNYRCLHLIRLA